MLNESENEIAIEREKFKTDRRRMTISTQSSFAPKICGRYRP